MVRVKHPQPHSTPPDQCKQQHIMDSTTAVPDGSGRLHQTKTPSSSFNKSERRLFFTTTFSTLRDMWAFTRPIYATTARTSRNPAPTSARTQSTNSPTTVPRTLPLRHRPTLGRIASFFLPNTRREGRVPSRSSLVDTDPQHHQPG